MAKTSGDIGPDHTTQGEHKQAVKDMFVLAMVDTLSMELPGFNSRHFIEVVQYIVVQGGKQHRRDSIPGTSLGLS